MAKNESISQLDAGQAFKRAMDADHDAIRVINAVDTELEITLVAEEGDSIQAVARTVCIKEADGDVDCSALRRVCKYGNGTIQVSPDGTTWVSLSMSDMQVKEICALKIRVAGCTVVGQS